VEEGYVSSKGLYDYANHRCDPAGVQNYISGKFEAGAVSATVEVPVGTYSVVDGLSDQQISRTGLGWQKSQNGGSEIPAAGPAESAYHRFGSRIPAADIAAPEFALAGEGWARPMAGAGDGDEYCGEGSQGGEESGDVGGREPGRPDPERRIDGLAFMEANAVRPAGAFDTAPGQVDRGREHAWVDAAGSLR
jgi:hypothetical protein